VQPFEGWQRSSTQSSSRGLEEGCWRTARTSEHWESNGKEALMIEWITAGECVQELDGEKDRVGARESFENILELAEVVNGGKPAREDKQG